MDNIINIAEESSKQLLFLDALDLGLLPTTYKSCYKDKANLLWSPKTLLSNKNDYFEFVIKSKLDNVEEVTTQESTHTVCYICNAFVPAAYVFEHVNSSKHKSYQKIAEAGLERAKKNKQTIGIERMKSPLEYFCEHCVTVIHLSNRNEHEKSKTHKNFAALDKFLDMFALFYTNKETTDIIDSKKVENEQNGSHGDISLLKVNTKVSENVIVERIVDFDKIPFKINNNKENTPTVIEKETKTLGNKFNGATILINAIKSYLDDSHKERELNNHGKADINNALGQYIKRLNIYGSVKLYTIDPFNEYRLRIETTDGYQFEVFTFNFHGFSRVGNYLKCKLCDNVVHNASHHKVFENHMKVVAQPFEDKHCIRSLRGPLSHCVLCNEVIDNSVVHTQFYGHTRKLEQALVRKGNTSTNFKTVKIVQSINDNNDLDSVNTDDEFSEKIESVISKTVEIDEEIDLKDIDEDTYMKTFKRVSRNHHYCFTCDTYMFYKSVGYHLGRIRHKQNFKLVNYYLKDKNNLCKVCFIAVPRYAWAVENHILTQDHVEKYNCYLADNKIVETKDSLFCKPCGIQLDAMSVLTHIDKYTHKVKIVASFNVTNNKQIKTRDSEHNDITVDSIEVKTKPIDERELYETTDNNINMANSGKHYSIPIYHEDKLNSQNFEGETSKADLGIQLSSGQIQRDTSNKIRSDNSPLYECNPWSGEISNNSFFINIHNNAIHKTADLFLCDVKNFFDELLKYINNPIEIHSHLQLTDVENVLNCTVCSDKVSVDNTEKHTSSLKHIRNHNKLMSVNKLKLKKDTYVCYGCNVYVEIGKELRHIESVEHEKRMEALQIGEYVLVTADNKKLVDKVYRDLKVMETKDDLGTAKDITIGDFVSANTEVKIDDVTNVRHHFCDLIDNKKHLICVLCQELVENTEDKYRTHANDIIHEIKYNTVMTCNQMFHVEDGYVCGFCECIVSGNEFAHILSEKHTAIQKNDPNKSFCLTCKVLTIDLGVKEHVTSAGHIEKIDASTHFYCNVCNLELTNGDLNIQRHNRGFEHQNNSSWIEAHKVVLKNKKCMCRVCGTTFSRDGLERHIDSLNHVMLLHPHLYQISDHCITEI